MNMLHARLDLTADELKRHLQYDPDSGLFFWLADRDHGKIKAGTVAGGRNATGVKIMINRNPYYAHRLAWLYMTGEWPAVFIDHANGNPHDNRWTNLRPADRHQNRQNARRQRNNTSAYKGVSRHKRSYGWAWQARIKAFSATYHLGYFDTPEKAHAAYVAAATRLHGEYARMS